MSWNQITVLRPCFGRAFFSLLGLLIAFESTLAQGPYNSFHVEVQPSAGVYRVIVTTPDRKPVSQDLSLQVVANVSNYRNRQSVFSKDLVIPTGQNFGVTEVAIGNLGNDRWSQTEIILEDNDNGVFDSRDFMRQSFSSRNNHANLDRILFVSSNVTSVESRTYMAKRRGSTSLSFGGLGVADPAILPNFMELLDLYVAYSLINKGSVTSNLSFLQNTNSNFHSISTSDFFEEWTSLFGCNCVLISKSDLQTLAQSEEQIDALIKWVSVGGQLIVFRCQADHRDREKILRLIAGQTNRQHQWQAPSAGLLKAEGFAMVRNWQVDQNEILFNEEDLPIVRFESATLDGSEALIKTDFLAGRIALISGDMSDWKQKDWQVLWNSLSRKSIAATVGEYNSDRQFKRDFRIPGIGEPPVAAFQALIAVFVLGIGPGAYFLFNRKGRLYLLLFAIPAFSLCAVAALFLYAIISDGFSIRGRVESVTQIDHRSGRAYTHARNVFYSGVSPNPSAFDAETLVHDSRTQYTPTTRFRYQDERLAVSGGQMRARSPFQLSSLECFSVDKRLTFSPSSDGQQGTLTNEIDSEFEIVVLRTSQGWFVAEAVDRESVAIAHLASLKDVREKIQAQIIRLRPKVELNSSRGIFNNNVTTIQDWGQKIKSKWGKVDDVLVELRSGFVDRLVAEDCYLAISKQNQFIDNPQPQAILEGNQVHVTIGKW